MNTIFTICLIGLYILGNIFTALVLINISKLIGKLLCEVKKNGSI